MAQVLAYDSGTFTSIHEESSGTPVTYQVEIYIEAYSGDPIPITVAEEGLILSLLPINDTPLWRVAPSEATVTILDDNRDKSPTVVAPLIGQAEQDVRLDIKEDGLVIFQGTVRPGDISYDTFLPGTTTITAVSGIAYLEREPYNNAGTPYSGRVTALEVVKNCVDKTNTPSALGYFLSTHWYPRLTSDSITGDEKDPFAHAIVHNDVYTDDEDVQFNCDVVLQDILSRFLARLWYWKGAWYIWQRHIDLDGDGSARQRSYLANLTRTFGAAYDMSQKSGDPTFMHEQGQTTIGSEGLVQTAVTYYHGTPDFGIIGNPGFEAPIEAEGSAGNGNWAPVTAAGGNSAERVLGGAPLEFDGGKWALRFEADSSDISTIPDDIVLGHHVKQNCGYVEGASGRSMKISFLINYDVGAQVNYGDGFFAFRWKVGDYWLTYNNVNNAYEWVEDGDIVNLEHYIVISTGQDKGWIPITIATNALYDVSVPISGNLYIELYQVVEDNNGGTGVAVAGRWDNIAFELVETDGTTANVATTTTCTLDSSSNHEVLDPIVVRTGTGPTIGYKNRITVNDNTDTEVESESNWQVGNNYVPAATGFNIDQLWCDEALRQTQVPLTRISGTFDLGSQADGTQVPYSPTQLVQQDVVTSVHTDYNFTTDGAIIRLSGSVYPKRRIKIGAEEALVESVRYVAASDCYDIVMSAALTSNYTAGEVVTMEILYTWDRLAYNLLANKVSGQWTELYLEDTVATAATADIKPGTSAANALSSGASAVTQIIINNTTSSRSAESIADLQTQNVGDEPVSITLFGHTAGSELGGGLFYGDPTDTTTVSDNGTVVTSLDGKRWKRIIDGAWSPTWFGAKFDGTTDDAAAWQACIDAAPDGAHVLAPAGVSIISVPIIVDGRPITVQGSGPSWYEDDTRTGFPAQQGGTVMKSATTLTGAIFQLQDTTNTSERRNAAHIKDIFFLGNHSAQNGATDNDTYAIDIRGCWGAKVSNCTINGFTSDGIRVSTAPAGLGNTSTAVSILSNTLAENGGYGLHMTGLNCIVQDNIVINNETGGMYEASSSSTNIYNSNQIFDNTGHGLEVLGVGGSVITGNMVGGSSSRGISLGSSAADSFWHVVTGNFCLNNGTDTGLANDNRCGLYIEKVKEAIIGNNVLSSNGSYGLYFVDNWQASVKGNTGSNNTVEFTNLRTQNIVGHYNVLEHGVLQRDNDAHLKVQALIDSVPDGSTIFFPDGDYKFSGVVSITKPLLIVGSGSNTEDGQSGSYITIPQGSADPAFFIDSDGVTIEKMNIIAADLVMGPSLQNHGIEYGTNVTTSILRNCTIKGMTNDGIHGQVGADGVQIDYVQVHSSGNTGIRSQGANWKISNCTVTDSTQDGIQGQGATGMLVTDCVSKDNDWAAIAFIDGERCMAMTNICEGNAISGIRIRSGQRHMAHDNHVYGNGTNATRTDAERSGIYIVEGDKHSVMHNMIGDAAAGATQQYGISTGDLLGSATILDNLFLTNVQGDYLLDSGTAGDLDIILFHEISDFNPTSLAAGAKYTVQETITGARGGDIVSFGKPTNWDDDLDIDGFVSANDTLDIAVFNHGTGTVDQAEGALKIRLERRGGATASVTPPTGLTMTFEHVYENHNILKHA